MRKVFATLTISGGKSVGDFQNYLRKKKKSEILRRPCEFENEFFRKNFELKNEIF